MWFLSAVSKARSFARYWLPVLIWMAVIFSASGDERSSQRSSRIIGPIVRWLFPHLPEESVGAIVFAARKVAHMVEYAVLAALAWRALRRPARSDPRPWSWRQATWACGFAVLYAVSDELHQLLVPSREAAVRDVLLDTAGAVLGLLLIRAIGRWRTWWPARAHSEIPKSSPAR